MRLRAGYPEFLTCVLAWGSIGVIVKEVALPSGVIVFFRLLFGVAVVLGWMAVRGRLPALRPGARPVLLVGSGAVLAGHWLLEFIAFKRLTVAASILLIFIGPVLAAALAPLVMPERLRAVAVGALAVAFGGITLITVPDIGGIDGAGVAAAAGSAALFAFLILADKVLAQRHEPDAIVVWQQAVAGVILAPALIGADAATVVRELGLLVLLGGLFTGALGILLFRAMRALETQRIGVLWYLEPVAAVGYAWWLLGERPAAATVAGGALIVAAGLAIILTDRAPGRIPAVAVEEAL